jgi:hypothetical protein
MTREFRHRASLALNAVLFVTVVALGLDKLGRSLAPSSGEAGPGKTTNPALAEGEKTASITRQNLAQYSDFPSPTDRRRWLADELRAAGVPNRIIARVTLDDLQEGWDRRFEETHGGTADTMAAMQLEQATNEEAEMRAALGEQGFRQWDQENMLHEANIGKIQLAASESDSIYDLKKTLQQRQRDLEQAKLKGTMDNSDFNDAEAKAYSDFNDQMKALLGDERYAESQGMGSNNMAANLRQDLAKVNPTDSQVQDLLQAQQQIDDRRAALDKQFQDDPSSPDYAAQLKALDDERDQQYASVLGTNVFDSLQKEQDPTYNEMKKCEDVWGLDDDKVDYVYDAMKQYQQSVQDYQAQANALQAQGQSVDWDAVNSNLVQFASQTQQSLQNYLGDGAFNKMQRNGVFQFNQSSGRVPLQ